MRALNMMEVEAVAGGVGGTFGWTIWQGTGGSELPASEFNDGGGTTPRVVITAPRPTYDETQQFLRMLDWLGCGFSLTKGGSAVSVLVDCGPAALDGATQAGILLKSYADSAIFETLTFIRNRAYGQVIP